MKKLIQKKVRKEKKMNIIKYKERKIRFKIMRINNYVKFKCVKYLRFKKIIRIF